MKKILFIAVATFSCLFGFCQNKISIDSVGRHIGDSVTVCSKVYGIKVLEKVTLINLGATYPNNPLTLVIFIKDRSNFKEAPEVMYAGKTICVTGVIKEYQGKPEIMVASPGDIQIQ